MYLCSKPRQTPFQSLDNYISKIFSSEILGKCMQAFLLPHNCMLMLRLILMILMLTQEHICKSASKSLWHSNTIFTIAMTSGLFGYFHAVFWGLGLTKSGKTFMVPKRFPQNSKGIRKGAFGPLWCSSGPLSSWTTLLAPLEVQKTEENRQNIDRTYM